MSHAAGGPDQIRLEFLYPLVHYIKPIFAATSAPEHAAALAAVQAYLDACLNENQAAVRKLTAERVRLHQICQPPNTRDAIVAFCVRIKQQKVLQGVLATMCC